MKPRKPAVVTGCKDNYPMEGYHGKPIHVGDRLRYQHCVGPYGQTTISETFVALPHYPYGQIADARFDLDWKRKVLVGYHKHVDFEHGHETWVEIFP